MADVSSNGNICLQKFPDFPDRTPVEQAGGQFEHGGSAPAVNAVEQVMHHTLGQLGEVDADRRQRRIAPVKLRQVVDDDAAEVAGDVEAMSVQRLKDARSGSGGVRSGGR